MFYGATWFIALRGFRRKAGGADIFQAIRASKYPPSFMVVFEDSAALIGLLVAFAGTYLSIRLDLRSSMASPRLSSPSCLQSPPAFSRARPRAC